MQTVTRLSRAGISLFVLCGYSGPSWSAPPPLPECRPVPPEQTHPPGLTIRTPDLHELPLAAQAWLATNEWPEKSSESERGAVWRAWVEREPASAAAALALHHALSRTWIRLPEGEVPFAELLGRVRCFEGDRIRVRVTPERFRAWLDAGATFRIEREDGEEESGAVEFHAGTALGGSLHEGYEIQGFTSRSRVPRLQWNYRSDVSEADIDLDGRAPLKWGWFPNPGHATWENSDVRHWFPRFLEKFGSPGFEVGG